MGLDTTHQPTHHPPPQTFERILGYLKARELPLPPCPPNLTLSRGEGGNENFIGNQ